VTDPKARPQAREIKAAGEKLEINIIPAEVRTAADIGQAYKIFSTGGAEIVVVEQSSMLVKPVKSSPRRQRQISCQRCMGIMSMSKQADLLATASTSTGVFTGRHISLTKYYKVPNRLTCRSSFQPRWNYGSTKRLQKRLASKFRLACS